ncbi:MAG: FG-GAP-like repeat-containing protein [Candidatus Njordarchaeia archaeon]
MSFIMSKKVKKIVVLILVILLLSLISFSIIVKLNISRYSKIDKVDLSTKWDFATVQSIDSDLAMADVDSDGLMEVVFCTSENVYALNAEDDSLLWNETIKDCHNPVIGDVNEDGKPDVLLVVRTIGVLALNGVDGSMLWNISGYYYVSSLTLGDVDGDGGLEVVVGSEHYVYVLNGVDGSLLWKFHSEYDWLSLVLGDVDGDGGLEVVVGSEHYVYVLNGVDGSLLWKVGGYWCASSLALGDVDGDGRLEIIFYNYGGYVYVLNGEDGSQLWKRKLYGDPIISITLGDLNNDDRLDVVCGNDAALYILDGENGLIISKNNWGIQESSEVYPLLYDIDGDNKLEMITNKGDTDIICYDVSEAGFRVYWEADAGYLSKNIFSHSLNTFDVDPDGDMLSSYSEAFVGTNASCWDSDGDGLPDGYEVYHGLDPLNPSDAFMDSDGDGLSNLQEFKLGTNPTRFDSDGDFHGDGLEVLTFTNPLDPWDNLLLRLLIGLLTVSIFLIIYMHRKR